MHFLENILHRYILSDYYKLVHLTILPRKHQNYFLNKWTVLYLRNWPVQQEFFGKAILRKNV